MRARYRIKFPTCNWQSNQSSLASLNGRWVGNNHFILCPRRRWMHLLQYYYGHDVTNSDTTHFIDRSSYLRPHGTIMHDTSVRSTAAASRASLSAVGAAHCGSIYAGDTTRIAYYQIRMFADTRWVIARIIITVERFMYSTRIVAHTHVTRLGERATLPIPFKNWFDACVLHTVCKWIPFQERKKKKQGTKFRWKLWIEEGKCVNDSRQHYSWIFLKIN